MADEIATIKSSYPGAKITVFECSKRYLSDLLAKYASDSDVSIIGQAVSDQIGRATFFETNLVGSGSLLELGNLHKQSYGSEAAEEFEVQTTTLDGYFGEASIDVLQIDVQGAEKLVLEGGKSVLRSTKAVFLETSVEPGLYEQSTTFDELYEIMKNAGFKLALVGTDFNLTGNALFVRRNLPTSLEPISMRW